MSASTEKIKRQVRQGERQRRGKKKYRKCEEENRMNIHKKMNEKKLRKIQPEKRKKKALSA